MGKCVQLVCTFSSSWCVYSHARIWLVVHTKRGCPLTRCLYGFVACARPRITSEKKSLVGEVVCRRGKNVSLANIDILHTLSTWRLALSGLDKVVRGRIRGDLDRCWMYCVKGTTSPPGSLCWDGLFLFDRSSRGEIPCNVWVLVRLISCGSHGNQIGEAGFGCVRIVEKQKYIEERASERRWEIAWNLQRRMIYLCFMSHSQTGLVLVMEQTQTKNLHRLTR